MSEACLGCCTHGLLGTPISGHQRRGPPLLTNVLHAHQVARKPCGSCSILHYCSLRIGWGAFLVHTHTQGLNWQCVSTHQDRGLLSALDNETVLQLPAPLN